MSVLDAFDLARIDYIAGFRGLDLSNIVAIQLSESSGNTDAHNTYGENSVGISQINIDAHPQYTVDQLFNPIQNAIAAFGISSGGADFSPWTSFTGGQYLSHLNDAQAAAIQATAEAGGQGATMVDFPGIPNVIPGGLFPQNWLERFKDWLRPGSGPADVAGGAASSVTGGISGALGKIGAFFGILVDPHTWARVGLTLGAVVLLGIGVLVFIQSSPEVRSAEAQAAKGAAAAGAAA